MKNIEIALSEETVRSINQLAALRSKSLEEMCRVLMENAVKDTQYRMKRNQQKWQENKALRALLKERPELLQEAMKGEE